MPAREAELLGSCSESSGDDDCGRGSKFANLPAKYKAAAAASAGLGVLVLGVGAVMIHSSMRGGVTQKRAFAEGDAEAAEPPPWGPERWGSHPGIATRRSTCATASDCENCSDTALSVCHEKVRKAMDMDEGELHKTYNPFLYKEHAGGWNQWYASMHRDALEFEDFQMMIYLHDGDGGYCPKPCVTAPAPAPHLCRPNTKYVTPPKNPLDYNGITWPEMCFEDDRDEEHVFLIGDWGGVRPGEPANNLLVLKDWLNPPVQVRRRDFVVGLDDQAQYLVAQQFNKRAAKLHAKGIGPRYVLNVGDNFYWSGCNGGCGGMSVDEAVKSYYKAAFDYDANHCSQQFYSIFETMYIGPGVNGIPWLSVLGNHDYGGFKYHTAWDLQVAYTWGPSGRWVLPGLYWHQYVNYPAKGFNIDYYFLDTNIADVTNPFQDPGHNICSMKYNAGGDLNCKPFGPADPHDCVQWFTNLWKEQMEWLDKSLDKSEATWQIIVTHIPLEACGHYPQAVTDIRRLAEKHGIDLIIAGHRHQQELQPTGFGRWCAGTEAGVPYVVTGGGGGITTEGKPSDVNNQYGYMDMILTADLITIKAFNQHGSLRGTMDVHPRQRGHKIVNVDPWENNTNHAGGVMT
eukprot:TRINITY_DN3322_c0_g1_i1.p1 TRINITY_DN3322_c0_g1~~TRINITY_DN3322_c0_g1_i1.p1  ORF type:complete len:627 (+),score=136.00 TRINITY_DN3322_c0_g1_i1:102-1982(+)